ncbi:hypothetical protein GWR56_14295 [Mucilaginibacter sp. 14171R-50]|uniref:DUF6786 family protein n=1 Tax=Mucilaginibacter sp. 14171R-50 TaxID=2703789 RepID=UPI00138DC84A|nr:DUF6786 family protein [Mucilaginibacter sp. 14171R-50]QHS56654.1 hypothetical protein GWR56_14295 [Mucilaginibacter sp. 14171R-50]
MTHFRNLLFALPILAVSCSQNAKKEQANIADTALLANGTFGYDLSFLQKHDSVIVLKSSDSMAQIIVSPKYQAKVFTSTANGADGRSFGWVNYKTFDAKPDEHMNAFGGEDRLWLGPEGGKFSLYFKPGTKMEFANWHTPPAIDNESWQLVSKSDNEVAMSKTTEMLNYANTLLKIKLDRTVKLFSTDDIQKMLGINAEHKVKAVGFSTTNTITNNGDKAWDKTTGAPCLWNLDMFSPSEKTVIVVPYHENTTGKVATTDYFGQIPPDRVKYNKGILLFKADGKSRGKLGMPPNRAKNMAGSYDPQNKVLTITMYDVDGKGTYLNQEWTPDKPPFTGDAVNAYNDGPLATGGQMGPFYEIESVSPAAFLKPGQKLTHNHSVFHFTGDEAQLNQIALKTLGISLKDIQAAFK